MNIKCELERCRPSTCTRTSQDSREPWKTVLAQYLFEEWSSSAEQARFNVFRRGAVVRPAALAMRSCETTG